MAIFEDKQNEAATPGRDAFDWAIVLPKDHTGYMSAVLGRRPARINVRRERLDFGEVRSRQAGVCHVNRTVQHRDANTGITERFGPKVGKAGDRRYIGRVSSRGVG